MKNRATEMIITLVENLKKNFEQYGIVVSAETEGVNFAAANIASTKDSVTELYKVIVIRQS